MLTISLDPIDSADMSFQVMDIREKKSDQRTRSETMSDLPSAARLYLDAKDREQEQRRIQQQEQKQNQWEKAKRLQDDEIKEAVLRGEQNGCGPHVCWMG